MGLVGMRNARPCSRTYDHVSRTEEAVVTGMHIEFSVHAIKKLGVRYIIRGRLARLSIDQAG